MKQEDWDTAIAQARAKLARLVERAESMTDEEYKDFKIAEMERQRFLQIEQIEKLAKTPVADHAAKYKVTQEVAAAALQQYQDTTPELFFERLLQSLRDTPADQLKVRDLMQFRRMATGIDTSPVPENLG